MIFTRELHRYKLRKKTAKAFRLPRGSNPSLLNTSRVLLHLSHLYEATWWERLKFKWVLCSSCSKILRRSKYNQTCMVTFIFLDVHLVAIRSLPKHPGNQNKRCEIILRVGKGGRPLEQKIIQEELSKEYGLRGPFILTASIVDCDPWMQLFLVFLLLYEKQAHVNQNKIICPW